MTSNTRLPIWIMAVVLFAAALATTDDAQEIPSCALNLVPCFAYMNVTKPPASCCTPLKLTIDTQLQCLCNLYNTPGLLPSFGINVTEAITLPARCGISGDLSACAQSPGSSTTTPAGDKNGAERMIASAVTILGMIVLFVLF